MTRQRMFFFFFFFNDTATTEIYTLSLHDALPICRGRGGSDRVGVWAVAGQLHADSAGDVLQGMAHPAGLDRDLCASTQHGNHGDVEGRGHAADALLTAFVVERER